MGNPKAEVALTLAEVSTDPLQCALYSFPWGEPGQLAKVQGPRPWQADILNTIGSHLRSPNWNQPLQVAVSSGHGIGKSALISMLIHWGMSTCTDCRIVVTAGTGVQLDTKTWPEVTKWFKMAINTDWWDTKAQSICAFEKGHERLWRADAITWNENNTEPFAGLHNVGKRLIIIYDEASQIADKIWEVTEGALTDEDTEIIWLAFGNPTRNTGRFKECFGKFKHRWVHRQIDSRTVEGTNKEQIAKWEQDWGEDSDFFRIRVKGEFPRAGTSQFIPQDAVDACRKYKAVGYESLPKIISVDVARFGDDQTVIGLRQGRHLRVLDRLRGMDTVQVAERVIQSIDLYQPDAVVVDGDGIGGGVVDQLKHRNYGRNLHEFHGGGKPDNPNKYFNRRAEVWGLMRDWLKEGAQIPDEPEFEADLTGTEYYFTSKQQVQLESKDDMKVRGLSSPDNADMLAMSFSVKVLAKAKAVVPRGNPMNAGGWMG